MKTEPREVWVQRVQRLTDSGLTTREFAREIGVNPHTLAGWRWRLTREAVEKQSASVPGPKPTFVEVTGESEGGPAASPGFEVLLVSGTRIRVPTSFEPSALRALLAAVEAR